MNAKNIHMNYYCNKLVVNKKIFVFDWDGTLFDSMNIKRNSFVSSFIQSYDNIKLDEKIIRDLYVELSGKPRHELFMELSKQLYLQPVESGYAVFNEVFNKLNLLTLNSAKLFKDVEGFIYDAYKNEKKMFISSSVPEEELRIITSSILTKEYRNKIEDTLGTAKHHQKGPSHIRDICNLIGCHKKDVLFFGDDYEDYKLSQEAGVDCIVVDRENRHLNLDIPIINSFYDVQDVIHGTV